MLTVAAEPPRPASPGGRRWLVPVAVSAVIAIWQFSFNSASPEPRRPYAMTASMGLCADAPLFFYYFHHFGLFPVGALEVPQLGPSKQAAADFVAHHGDRLVMDFGWPTNTPRFGDYAKLFLFYPDLWLRGDPSHPSAIPFNELLFIVALLAVFWAFWLEGYGRLGALIVVLVGSDPFQIVETYGRGNIFSIPISVALLALAAHLRFLTRRKGIDALAWTIAIVSGVALATFREIRAEAGIIAISAIAAYLVARAPLAKRLLLVVGFVLAFAITGAAWSTYWAGKFTQAERFVARAGGQVFRAPRGPHHAFWHAVYCGLGDYGADRGFSWDDRVAFRWATTRDPATNPDPLPFHYVRGYYLEETFDGVHHIAPTDLPEYHRLVRARVLTEVRQHPWWYGGVLFRRAVAIQRDATPAALSLGSITLALPGAGWVTGPVLLFALWRRRYFHAMLILFLLPLSAVALLVYSGKGMTSYGIAHLVALAVAIDLLVRSRWPAAVTGRSDVR
jgi:hypothetical protein